MRRKAAPLSDTVHTQHGVLSAEEALTFLDEASAHLATSLDVDETLRRIAQLTVPTLADWCAIDVASDDGALRQITSGHPDPEQERFLAELRRRYRAEKGGSEGVARVIATGEPELVADVRGIARARMEIREDEAELYERLGPRSYLIVPLVARDRTLGAMTLLSCHEGRHYGEGDLAFAQHLARRFALAIDNARLYSEAEASRAGLDDFFTSAPIGLAFFDDRARYVRVNPALARLNGTPVDEHIGRTPGELLGPAGEAAEAVVLGVLETGEPVRDLEASGPLPWAPGETGHWLVSFTPIRDRDGRVTGVSGVVLDVTDRRRALDAERDAARRAAFMADAGAVLDASMDYVRMLDELVALAVPELADWCVAWLLDDEGDLHCTSVAHEDPERARWALEIGKRRPPVVGAPAGVGYVVAMGEAEVVDAVRDDLLRRIAEDAEHLEELRSLGVASGAVVPLVARGRTLGALSFGSSVPARYEPADVQLLAELGRRAGVAIENARLYTERSRIAHTLQARLLPSRLPAPPGVRLAARYRAAGEFNEVGGDFYDAFQRAPDEWAVVIGDVSGKGPEAAALTAMARYTIRAAALNDWAPAHVLRRLNDTLLREDESQFVTVALAYVSHAGQDTVVKLVLGGHPPPFLVRASGEVVPVGVPGTLLGIRGAIRLTQVEVVLSAGDSLLLYTDGVIEAGPRDAPFAEEGLCALLEGLTGADPETLVAAVDAAAHDADGGRARDDVAILALTATHVAPPPQEIEIVRPADPSILREVREEVVAFAARMPSAIDLDDVRLAVAEACANVLVHAYRADGESGILRIRAIDDDGKLVVEIRDEGCGPAPRPDSPGLGLGLPLMSRLATELEVLDREPAGTLVRMTFRP